jgi:VanZ family protein
MVVVANVLWAACLVVLGLMPDVPREAAAVPDDTAHALAYGIQSGLVYLLALPTAGRKLAAVFAAVGAASYGALVEILQMLQPSRSPEVADLVANAAGAGLAAAAAYLVTGALVKETGR